MRRPRAIAALTLSVLAAATSSATAASDVVVYGTVDVRDAGLLEQQIIEDFEADNGEFDLKYIASGSAEAFTAARAGQADAILVNAPDLEDEFVRQRYASEPTGRAVFFNDHVLVGPPGDPAGVMTAAPHDAARAFELIAAAGNAGIANFVSRSDDDGSNFAERDVWDKTNVARNSRSEPGSGTSDNPPWYRKAHGGAATTLALADKCEFPGGGCYTLVDRGSYTRLARNGSLKSLRLLVERNDDDTPGGAGLLVNPYHVYGVSSTRVAGVNTDGVEAFLEYMTSREFQEDVDRFPDPTADPYFFASARPELNLANPPSGRLPRKVRADQTQVISGRLVHLQPAFGPLRGTRVFINRIETDDDLVQLGSDNTDAQGDYRLEFRPTRTGEYRFLFPGDFDLQPAYRDLGRVRVRAVVNLTSTRVRKGGVRLRGKAYPDRDRADARLVVQGRRGGKGRFRSLHTLELGDTGRSFVTNLTLDNGQWELRVRYVDSGVVDSGLSASRSVSVR